VPKYVKKIRIQLVNEFGFGVGKGLLEDSLGVVFRGTVLDWEQN